MKGTGAKRNVCPGSCVSTGAKFPVAPVESAPMGRQTDGRTLHRYVGLDPAAYYASSANNAFLYDANVHRALKEANLFCM